MIKKLNKKAFTFGTLGWLLLILLSGCGNYFSATIQGYVIDSESETGINGATVFIFNEKPEGLTGTSEYEDNAITYVGTATQGGAAGYFSSKYIWSSTIGSFWPDGDSGTSWIIVTHPDYQPSIIIERKGILSDTTSIIPDIGLTLSRFRGPEIRGQVLVNGLGQNGIRVSLQVHTDDPASQSKRFATTQTFEGTQGIYRFTEPRWDDPDAEDGTSIAQAIIAVDDPDYTTASITLNNLLSTTTNTDVLDVEDPLNVNRESRTQFTTTVQGRVYRIAGDAQIGVEGIIVEISYESFLNGAVSETKKIIRRTGTDGRYSIPLTWIDTTPGGFDGEDENGLGIADDEIPPGEDGLLVTYRFIDESPDPDPAFPRTLTARKVASTENPWFGPSFQYGP